MTRIDVTSGSRLHFGLICSEPATQWRFGGIGVMLRQPAWRVSVSSISADSDRIEAADEICQRIRVFLKCIRLHQSVDSLRIAIQHDVPFHTGLGSGTQLGLALSAAIELMTHRRLQEDPFQLARLSDRAERSAIGTVGFARGGFLVDHGESRGSSFGRKVDRILFPEDWRFVLVYPVDSRGVSGELERTFFGQRISMPLTLVEDLQHQILQQIVPAVQEQQFGAFASSLESYGKAVGTFYAAEQGGVFADPGMAQLAADLRSSGVSGMAQSSWGPLIGIPAASQQHAEEIMQLIPDSVGRRGLHTSVSEPLNTGASIQSTVDEACGRGLA